MRSRLAKRLESACHGRDPMDNLNDDKSTRSHIVSIAVAGTTVTMRKAL